MTDLTSNVRPLANRLYRRRLRPRIRSPRLTWSDTSSKSARPAKDFESCETVSITESAQCSLVRCAAQLVNHELTSLHMITARQARMNTNHQMIFRRPGSTGRWPVGAGCQPARTFQETNQGKPR